MEGLKNVVAVVTGGSSGIGQAIAIRLGEEGVNVAINTSVAPRAPEGDAGVDREGRAAGRTRSSEPKVRRRTGPTRNAGSIATVAWITLSLTPCRASLSAPRSDCEVGGRTTNSLQRPTTPPG
jgi:NAD(P)-dependent dehydrogenase (short-subunit alcohol dehydrogenase family)